MVFSSVQFALDPIRYLPKVVGVGPDPPHSALTAALGFEWGARREARKGGKVAEEVGVGGPNDTRIAAERECRRGRDQRASGTKDYQWATEGVEA